MQIELNDKALAIVEKTKLVDLAVNKSELKILINNLADHVQKITLGDNVNVARKIALFKENAEIAFTKPDLVKNGNVFSIIGCLLECVNLDLSLSPTLGQAYLVSYGGKNPKVQLQIGYRGWVQMFNRTGLVLNYDCNVVYKDDFYDEIHEDGVAKYKYKKLSQDDTDYSEGNLLGAYVAIRMVNGGLFFKYMSRKQLEKLRKKNTSQSYFDQARGKYVPYGEPVGIWAEWYDEMAFAKIFQNLKKTFPLMPDIKDGYIFGGSIKNGVIDISHEDVITEESTLAIPETIDDGTIELLNSIKLLSHLDDFEKEHTKTPELMDAITEKRKNLVQDFLESPDHYEPIIEKIQGLIGTKDFNKLTATIDRYKLRRTDFKAHPLSIAIRKQIAYIQQTFISEWLASNPSNESIDKIPETYLATFGFKIETNPLLFKEFTASAEAQKALNND